MERATFVTHIGGATPLWDRVLLKMFTQEIDGEISLYVR